MVKVFFYGLFMDQELLASNDISVASAARGYVEGYALRIGERATLTADPGGRAYGVVMEVAASDVARLYAQDSVADYVPETVLVRVLDDAGSNDTQGATAGLASNKLASTQQATCYNLPAHKVTGANQGYAAALWQLARLLDFPDAYLEQIKDGAQDT